jgi:hypothetical protein
MLLTNSDESLTRSILSGSSLETTKSMLILAQTKTLEACLPCDITIYFLILFNISLSQATKISSSCSHGNPDNGIPEP